MLKAKTWTTFLKPGWIITFLLIISFTYLAFDVLAPWQLHKNTTVSERNHRVEASFSQDPAPYPEVFRADGSLHPDNEYRRVLLTGHYLPDSEVVMRLRPVEGGPAYHALTPFQIDGGPTVLVNRGWMRPDNGHFPTAFPVAPTSTVVISGYARLSEAEPQIGPTSESERTMVTGIHVPQIAKLTSTPLTPDYVQLASDQPGVLTAFPLPTLDNGPHLSYGIQWIGFGILAPIALGYFVFAELRERRREEEEQRELAGATSAATPEATSHAPQVAPQRSRYGSTSARANWQRDDEQRY